MQIGLFCCRMRLPSFPADCGRLIWMCTHLAIYLHHLPISHGAYSHLFAVADDNAPLTIVQAVWLSSSCRTFHLGTQSQRDDWLTYAFPLGISLAGKPDDDRVSDFTFSLPLAKGGICIVPRCLRCFRRLPDARTPHPRIPRCISRPGGWWLPGFEWSPW